MWSFGAVANVVQPSHARGVHGVVGDDTILRRFVSSGCSFPRRVFCRGGGVVVWRSVHDLRRACPASAGVPTSDLILPEKNTVPHTYLCVCLGCGRWRSKPQVLACAPILHVHLVSVLRKGLFIAARKLWSSRFSSWRGTPTSAVALCSVSSPSMSPSSRQCFCTLSLPNQLKTRIRQAPRCVFIVSVKDPDAVLSFSLLVWCEFVSATACVSFVLCFLHVRCTAHCHQQCVRAKLANRASHLSCDRFFSRGYDPYTHAGKARTLTTVGRTSLSVIIININSALGTMISVAVSNS